MQLAKVIELLQPDLDTVNKLMAANMSSNVPLITEISNYLIEAGGKRLRPLMLLLCARACSYQGSKHIDFALAIEFIHSATLLHDDVVDSSELRRGRKTSNYIWGNGAAVLVGDFLYSKAFQLIVEVNNQNALKTIADTTIIIAEGEVLQLLSLNNPETSEIDYFKIIECKTAKLFAASAKIGAILSQCSPVLANNVEQYGLLFGIAFQLIDDLLDYQSTPDKSLGKNIGDDLAEGKVTLPLIYLLQHGSHEEKQLVTNAIVNGSTENLTLIQQAITKSKAAEYILRLAKGKIETAKQNILELPASPYRDAAIELADFVVARKY